MAEEQVQKLIAELDDAPAEVQKVVLAHLRTRHLIHDLEAEWNVPAEVILEAISRSSDLSQRGVRGLIAEAYFEIDVVPKLKDWGNEDASENEDFDYLLSKGRKKVKVEVKQQRSEKGEPAMYKKTGEYKDYYKVETQKTRTGTKKGKKTRPYRVGDFDLIAVNMRASTGDWKRFFYAPASALLTKHDAPDEFETMQPVPPEPNEIWSDDINVALKRLEHGFSNESDTDASGLF